MVHLYNGKSLFFFSTDIVVLVLEEIKNNTCSVLLLKSSLLKYLPFMTYWRNAEPAYPDTSAKRIKLFVYIFKLAQKLMFLYLKWKRHNVLLLSHYSNYIVCSLSSNSSAPYCAIKASLLG